MVRNLILGKNNQQKEDKPRKFMCVHIKKKIQIENNLVIKSTQQANKHTNKTSLINNQK